MRVQAFAILLVALLPKVTASAAPFAQYNPANGDISFHDVSGGIQIRLLSKLGQLNPSLEKLPMELIPINASPPDKFSLWRTHEALWHKDSPSATVFQFNTLTVRGAIVPHTPLDDLGFGFHPSNAAIPYGAPIILVPEPSTIALAVLGAVVVLRRRK